MTPEGLVQIRVIKAGMNRGRLNNLLLNTGITSYHPSGGKQDVSKLRESKSLKTPRTQIRTFSSFGVKANIEYNKGTTQLVVQETCLGSRMVHCQKEIENTLAITSYHYSIFIGLLLSDGWISTYYKTNTNPRLKFRQPYSKYKVILSVFNNIAGYCERYPYYYGRMAKGKPISHVIIRTQILPCFKNLHALFFFFFLEKQKDYQKIYTIFWHRWL